MVSARLVELPDSPEVPVMKPIPEMMFAAGEEPVGVRVLTYQSSGALKRILNALEDEEIDVIRDSAFGKVIGIAGKPVFSGRFARYIMSRQLKTKKKHESWFWFAGKLIRFSLREFAIVTGLPCGPFPRRSKMKLKESIAEKPYWPVLFGKSEVVTVASVIKMLWRKTVTDKEIRIKYACLAILSSVLLPTSLKMKICREHAEAIEDLGEFFAYPWGRLAFDLLMVSIREWDVVALSQSNIAVKGFVLALQLVMVEAVPSLTEVVQESCSSSEDDSEDDVFNSCDRFGKKQTLNPAHARFVDKTENVVVYSLLKEEPERPIDESSLVWSGEEHDETVENMVDLINVNYPFTTSHFVGGVSRTEVDRLREASSLSSKSKKLKKPASVPYSKEAGYIADVVIERLKPQLQNFDNKIEQLSSRVELIEGKVIGIVNCVLSNFKDEIDRSVKEMVPDLCKCYAEDCRVPAHTLVVRGNRPGMSAHQDNAVLDSNANAILNIIQNISEYSTPPSSPQNIQSGDAITPIELVVKPGIANPDPATDCGAMSAHSQNHSRHTDNIIHLEDVNTVPPHLIEPPSFSLGLTQEEHIRPADPLAPQEVLNATTLSDINVGDNMAYPQSPRKSKRQKTVPPTLAHDYLCDPRIDSRLRRPRESVFVSYEKREVERKINVLFEKLYGNIVINVSGIAVSSKEILLLAERSRLYPGKVVDILIRLVRCVVSLPKSTERSYYLLDTRFGASIVRNYQKFLKAKKKESFKFSKGVLDYFSESDASPLLGIRYYFPLNIGKKHWIGVCFDPYREKLFVLDCNVALFSETSMGRFLSPFLQMLPYLARQFGKEMRAQRLVPYKFVRSKSVFQSDNPAYAGLIAVLLMVKHAVYGFQACRHLSPELLVMKERVLL